MDDREEKKEIERRIELKKELYQELEQRLVEERRKWEKHFILDLSNSAFLRLRDERGDQKEFILILTCKKNGVLGKQMKVELKYLLKLANEKKLKFSPWIYQIDFGTKPFFPFSPEQDNITTSPTFILAKNQGYVEDKIDPYNVKLAGFLFVNYPKYGNFLEAVSGSVVGNLSVVEKIMQRNKEPYSRENHLLNWLYFFTSKDSSKISFQIFNMHSKYLEKFKTSLEKFKTSFK